MVCLNVNWQRPQPFPALTVPKVDDPKTLSQLSSSYDVGIIGKFFRLQELWERGEVELGLDVAEANLTELDLRLGEDHQLTALAKMYTAKFLGESKDPSDLYCARELLVDAWEVWSHVHPQDWLILHELGVQRALLELLDNQTSTALEFFTGVLNTLPQAVAMLTKYGTEEDYLKFTDSLFKIALLLGEVEQHETGLRFVMVAGECLAKLVGDASALVKMGEVFDELNFIDLAAEYLMFALDQQHELSATQNHYCIKTLNELVAELEDSAVTDNSLDSATVIKQIELATEIRHYLSQ